MSGDAAGFGRQLVADRVKPSRAEPPTGLDPGRALRRVSGLAAALGLSVAAVPALAQASASVSATSEFRLRGISVNGGGLALSGSIAWDHPSGIFAGASVTGGDTRRFGRQLLGHAEVIGYAGRLRPGLAFEAGVSNTHVFSNVYSRFSGNYVEAFAGVSSDTLSARVWFSPAFIRPDLVTAYIDLNAVFRPAERLRVFGHGGLLVPLSGAGPAVLPRARYDLRLGAAAEFDRFEVQLAWVRSGAGEAFLASRRQSADVLQLGASWFF